MESVSQLIYAISSRSRDEELDGAIVNLREQLDTCTDELERLYLHEAPSPADHKKLADTKDRLRDLATYAGVTAFEKMYRLSVAAKSTS